MNLSKKMVIRTIIYFITVYFVFLLLSVGLIGIFIKKNITDSTLFEDDIIGFYNEEFDLYIKETKDGETKFSEDIIKIAESNRGVIQLINSQTGESIHTPKTSNQLKEKYSNDDLNRFFNRDDVYLWDLKNDLAVIYIEEKTGNLLLNQLKQVEDYPKIKNTKLLKENDAALEIYTNKGDLIYSVNNDTLKELSLIDIMASKNNANDKKESLVTDTLLNGDILVIRTNNETYLDFNKDMFNFVKVVVYTLLIFHGLVILFMFFFSLLISRAFGKPIMYFLKWIEQLAENDFTTPNDKRIRNKRNNELKRPYKIYKDVDDSLLTLTNKLNEDEQALKQIEEKRKDWITGLSHDLKTPLSTIYGYAKMLGSEHDWSSREVKDFAKVMITKAEYMDELITDLTYTYELKENEIEMHKEELEINHFLTEYIESRSDKDLNIKKTNETCYLMIDRIKIRRVLDNIVDNAFKHSSIGTQVYIESCLVDSSIEIRISNEGKVIPKEIITDIFTRYYRGQNTEEDTSGSGLGLAISKQLVEAHNGSIRVHSTDDLTTFIISLPCN